MFALSGAEEVLVQHVSPRGPTVAAVRATLVLSALGGLKEKGVFDAFTAQLPEPLHEPLLGASALSWVPIEQLVEMCLAVDRLRLTDRLLAEIGASAAKTIGATVLSVLLRTAGATPWTILAAIGRLWDRFYEGGAITVLRLAPTEAWVEMRGLPHAVSRYSRATTLAFFQELAGKLVRGPCAALTRAREPAPTTLAFTVSWT